MLLASIPLLCFICLLLVLGNVQTELDWRRTFLRTSLLWGGYAILILEPLSAFEMISPLYLALVWIIPTTGLCLKLFQMNRQTHRLHLPTVKIPDSNINRVLFVGIGLSLMITLIIAWIAPPQTADSLVYHMSRVAHWAQNQPIRPYATGIRFQNTMSKAAELIILHFYVLTGSDKMANLVQWFAMAGSLIGVSLVADKLGANRSARTFSVAFAASLPMGIVQASSTMTDYVLAFWMICAASEVLLLINEKTTNPSSSVFLGLAVGLAIATKPTSFSFLLPFAFLVAIILLRRLSMRRFILISVLIVFCITTLNFAHYLRNYALYDNPLGFEQTFQRHANRLINAKVILSNTLRHASLHVGTIWPEVNEWIYQQIVKVHVKTGIDINDPRTTFTEFRILAPSTNENLVGNPIHALIILVSIILTVTLWSRMDPMTRIFAIAVASGFIIFSAMFKYQIFGSRLQLPFFILSAPIIATILSKIKNTWLIPSLGIVLIIASFPWLFQISSRSIITKSEESVVGSIFSASRIDLYFPKSQSAAAVYHRIADRIEDRGCSDIGLMLSGSSSEYLWWVLLGAPRDDLRLEWIVSDSPTAAYGDESFEPCAVICENCPSEWTTIRGLQLAKDVLASQFNLFLEVEGK